MKIKQILMAAVCSALIFSSCKKDKTAEPVINTDPELLGAQTDKVMHYSFNGTLNDGSGSNLNAINSTNISYATDRFGRNNQAAAFAGPLNLSYAAIPSPGSQLTGFPFSVSLWLKATDVSRSQTLVKADGGEYNVYSGYWLQMGVLGTGTMSFSIGDNSGTTSSNSRNTITTPAVFSANTWYHVVVNVRGANDMDFYINGVKNNNCSYDGSATSIVFCSQANQQIGFLGIYMGSAYEGLMDDYRVYKKILSPDEISALYSFHP